MGCSKCGKTVSPLKIRKSVQKDPIKQQRVALRPTNKIIRNNARIKINQDVDKHRA